MRALAVKKIKRELITGRRWNVRVAMTTRSAAAALDNSKSIELIREESRDSFTNGRIIVAAKRLVCARGNPILFFFFFFFCTLRLETKKLWVLFALPSSSYFLGQLSGTNGLIALLWRKGNLRTQKALEKSLFSSAGQLASRTPGVWGRRTQNRNYTTSQDGTHLQVSFLFSRFGRRFERGTKSRSWRWNRCERCEQWTYARTRRTRRNPLARVDRGGTRPVFLHTGRRHWSFF